MDDPYHNNVNQQMGGEYAYTQDGGGQDGYPYQTDYPPQDEDAASDATEGADEDNQMYEGEYQGIPHPDEIKEARRAARIEARRKARMAAQQQEEEETLPEQYETIMEDCGHGRFQWMLFFVLGLALMADGVDGFVVGFVMPSAEKDMCISNSDKGLLGKKQKASAPPAFRTLPSPQSRRSHWYAARADPRTQAHRRRSRSEQTQLQMKARRLIPQKSREAGR